MGQWCGNKVRLESPSEVVQKRRRSTYYEIAFTLDRVNEQTSAQRKQGRRSAKQWRDTLHVDVPAGNTQANSATVGDRRYSRNASCICLLSRNLPRETPCRPDAVRDARDLRNTDTRCAPSASPLSPRSSTWIRPTTAGLCAARGM